MNADPLYQRMHDHGLSLWEIGELLGIHPHHLHRGDDAGGLYDQPVRVLIDLARRLDLHPADLVPALEVLLANPRTDTPPPAASDGSRDGDALTVLTALVTVPAPMSVDELATALTWDLDRTAAALHHSAEQPQLGGPVAVRRVPPGRWTATARRSRLSAQQQTNLAEAGRYRASLTLDEANALLAAYRLGHTSEYAELRPRLPGEQSLKDSGLIKCDNGPHRASPTSDVGYSINHHQHQ